MDFKIGSKLKFYAFLWKFMLIVQQYLHCIGCLYVSIYVIFEIKPTKLNQTESLESPNSGRPVCIDY